MTIGERIRYLREHQKLSQGDIEKRTGLLRCYVSRVENGYTVPALETLEKFARALEVPMWQLVYDGDQPSEGPTINSADRGFGNSGRERRYLTRLVKALSRLKARDRALLFQLAKLMAKR